jgi:hypothetical protein
MSKNTENINLTVLLTLLSFSLGDALTLLSLDLAVFLKLLNFDLVVSVPDIRDGAS